MSKRLRQIIFCVFVASLTVFLALVLHSGPLPGQVDPIRAMSCATGAAALVTGFVTFSGLLDVK